MKNTSDFDNMSPEHKMDLGEKPTEVVEVAAARAAHTVKAPMVAQTEPHPPQPQPQPLEQKAPVQPRAQPQPQAKAASAPAPENATRVLLPQNWGQAAEAPEKGKGSPAGRGDAAPADPQGAPVVGFLVVVDGPGKGSYRAVYGGANTIGRSANQRIPIDFGDETISGEQQAFLVYDARTRQFQLVPNLGKPNLVHLNDQALLTNALLKAHDKITIGATMLLFMPLCDQDFDWSDAVA